MSVPQVRLRCHTGAAATTCSGSKVHAKHIRVRGNERSGSENNGFEAPLERLRYDIYC